MVPKQVSISVAGILILLVIGAMIWQVAPVSAGLTPTPSPTATPPLLLPPTGGPTSVLSNIEAIAILLAVMVVVLLVMLSLVIRDSARAKNG